MRDGKHDCPWPGCTERVPRHLWGCKAHWFALPRALRDRCSGAWRAGDVRAHVEALEAIDEWLRDNAWPSRQLSLVEGL